MPVHILGLTLLKESNCKLLSGMNSYSIIFEKIKTNKTLRDGGLFSLFSFLGQGVSFVLLILLANYIRPSEYGHLSLFSTVTVFLGYFTGLASIGYSSISFFKKSNREFRKDFSACFSLYFLTTFFFMGVLLLLGDSISYLLNMPIRLLWYAIIISFANALFAILLELFRIKENIYNYGLLSCGSAFLNFFLSLFLVVDRGQSWMGRVNAQLICTTIFCLIAFFFFFKYRLFDFHYSVTRYKPILLWCLPIIPHLTTNWIRQGCDRFIIDYNFSVNEVGLFSFALNLVGILNMVGCAFNSTSSVSFYQLLSSKNDSIIVAKQISRHTRMMFKVYTGASLSLIIILPSIVYLFLPKYIPSLGYFFVLGVFGYFQCLYYLYCNFLFYYGKTKVMMYITFTTSVIHLILSLVFTRYSLYCTAMIYIFVESLLLYSVYYVARKLRIEHSLM